MPLKPTLAERLTLRAVKLFEPERAHGLTVRALRSGLGPRAGMAANPALATTVGGLALPNPVGLAAGFDKNAEVPDAMLRAGFGFVECGTVTPRPQAGNPRPRLFRLVEDEAVVNRMGFNNEGLEAFARRLSARLRRGRGGVVGANLGANKDSPDRVGDYVLGLKRLWGLCDYFTVNISSPNTPGLRSLQDEEALGELLSRIAAARREMEADGPEDRKGHGRGEGTGRRTPVFLKVAPDIAPGDPGRITEQAIAHGLDAIICSNTTLSREGLRSRHAGEGGGMSGRPLFARSTEVLREFGRASAGRIDLVGVGGIASGADAYAKIGAGASAVQLYSALVYHGPSLVGRIQAELLNLLARDGHAGIADAVGWDL